MPGTNFDDLQRLRRALEELEIRADPQLMELVEQGAASMVVRTKTITTYPTNASRFFACSPVVITGTESEGSTGTKTADTSATFYAFNLGSSIPASGTDILIVSVPHRWVFRYD